MQTKFSKSTLGKLGRLGILAGMALAVGLAGCKSTPDRTSGQKMSDRQIARSVNKGLAKDPTFKYPNVHQHVYLGTVQLTGFVDTPEQRLRAAEIAAQTKGAKQVINEIMIKPMPTGPVPIRDPLGRDTGRLLVDTNSPVPQLRNLPETQQQPQQQPAPQPGQPTEGNPPR